MQRIQKSVTRRLAFLAPAALAAVLAVLGTVAGASAHSGDARLTSAADHQDKPGKGTSEFNSKA
ncbi:hypothetical protein [Kitasatospora sp. NPDC056531]|uniref:hypothetical protein n=1 Tax=Kitasatospora sp. NPDC056531 TaxID=3345856 RepID=UPI003677D3AB